MTITFNFIPNIHLPFSFYFPFLLFSCGFWIIDKLTTISHLALWLWTLFLIELKESCFIQHLISSRRASTSSSLPKSNIYLCESHAISHETIYICTFVLIEWIYFWFNSRELLRSWISFPTFNKIMYLCSKQYEHACITLTSDSFRTGTHRDHQHNLHVWQVI